MNEFIRVMVALTLLVSAFLVHVGMMVFGFICGFIPAFQFMYSLTPFIGLIACICIIKCALYVLFESNPIVYLKETFNKIKNFANKGNNE